MQHRDKATKLTQTDTSHNPDPGLDPNAHLPWQNPILRLHAQAAAAPLEVRGLWHPLLLLGDGEAAGIRVQPNDLALGG